MAQPPLKGLHSESSLSTTKLEQLNKLSTEEIIMSLQPHTPNSLRVTSDGIIKEGNHRIKILRERGIDVDSLPREIIKNQDDEFY